MLKPAHIIPLTALSAILSSTYVNAADYQSEISASYANSDSERRDDSDYGVSGTYYFKPVDSSQGPLAEAAFLQRASGISLTYTRSESDYAFSQLDGSVARGSADRDTYSARLDFYVPNSIFYAGLMVSHGRTNFEGVVLLNDDPLSDPLSAKESDTHVAAELGITPAEGLRITSIFYEDQDLDDDWNIGARWVTDAPGPSIALEGRYSYVGGADVINLGADFYIDRSFSIGLTHNRSLEFSDYSATGIRARKFFTENVSVEASYVDDQNGFFNLGATMRF